MIEQTRTCTLDYIVHHEMKSISQMNDKHCYAYLCIKIFFADKNHITFQ